MSKTSVKRKLSVALIVGCVLFVLAFIFLPKQFQEGSFLTSICAGLGALVASLYESKSNKKTKEIERDINDNIDILYTSRRVKPKHQIILMRKVERQLAKIIHDESTGKEVNQSTKKLLLDLHHKHHGESIVYSSNEFISYVQAMNARVDIERKISEAESKMEAEVTDGLKNHTVTQMFLVKKRKELSLAKNISIFTIILVAGLAYFLAPKEQLVCLAPAAFYLILLVKEKILTYRVEMGYFGANKFEATQLLQYIEKNKDDFDLNGGGGSKRKVFKPIVEGEEKIPSPNLGGVFQ
ncbi:hypothetical protein K5Y32_22025 [Pantoea sp. DY-15]|uniref:hypothetical protein n=1 Tax=Pantoea sp. DY-15 TaxID=2871489 RepID=UPI001C98D903|nr:hypothetical protein [Pantoea sp. DY-15]MBY4890620.1 hypothetical protein [Pantoea sp. DY-15]